MENEEYMDEIILDLMDPYREDLIDPMLYSRFRIGLKALYEIYKLEKR